MSTPDLFEELLATYPADKRELARQIYYRFVEGDSTQFFTQLFILLDVYAHYAERVPQAIMEANQNAHAGLARVREEIGLLAQAIEKRNVNINNQAEVTAELCAKTVAQCQETITRFESALKNVGAQVDAQAIVAGVQETLKSGIQREVIAPFLIRSKELTNEVSPALREIRENVAKASKLWPLRIWWMAVWCSIILTLTLSVIATLVIDVMLKRQNERRLAEQIARTARVMNYNQDAFRQLAIAQVPIKVVRSLGTNGVPEPQGFALWIENADAAELRRMEGREMGLIFFTGKMPERTIQALQKQTEQLAQPLDPGKNRFICFPRRDTKTPSPSVPAFSCRAPPLRADPPGVSRSLPAALRPAARSGRVRALNHPPLACSRKLATYSLMQYESFQ